MAVRLVVHAKSGPAYLGIQYTILVIQTNLSIRLVWCSFPFLQLTAHSCGEAHLFSRETIAFQNALFEEVFLKNVFQHPEFLFQKSLLYSLLSFLAVKCHVYVFYSI